jgi:uridine kinase
MRGDIILVEACHRRAAADLMDHLVPAISPLDCPLSIGISGESGSGKSELARALHEALTDHGLRSVVLQQDDYFVYPPRTNDAKRRQDFDWIGPQEVQLDRLGQDLQAIVHGANQITKPLVVYAEDRVDVEQINTSGCHVVIAEGTYVTRLECLDWRVFIDRTYRETNVARRRRGREAPDPFLERVLAREHEIIRSQREDATFLVHSDFTVSAQSTILGERKHATA